MTKYFKKNTDQLFYFYELKKCVKNDEIFVSFDEEDISSCRMLKDLIKKNVFTEIKEEQFLEGKVILESLKEIKIVPENKSNPYDLPTKQPDSIDLWTQKREERGNLKKEAEIKQDFSEKRFSDNIHSFGDSERSKIKEVKKNIVDGIWWQGPAADAGGYGKMNRKCLELLFGRGHKIQLDQPKYLIPDFRCTVKITDALKTMLETQVPEDAPSVFGIIPPAYLPRVGKKFLFTMIETSEIPERFAMKCNNANEIWLPSKFNMEIFEKAKEDKKIQKHVEFVHMPLGVDLDLYHEFEVSEEQKNSFKFERKGFVFLSLFGWSLRKGCDVLLRSYLEEFGKNDDTTLLIVSRKDGSSSMEKNAEIRDQIKSYITRYGKENDIPHIVHIGDAIEEELLPVIYNLSDCFVLPTRGEGFGLPMAEAGACGLPVITTRCGGQLDFLNDDNSFLIDIEGYDIACQEIKSISSYYEDVPFAVLGDKATQQTKEFMRGIYERNISTSEKVMNLKENLKNNFTWDILVDKIEKRLC